MAVFVLNAEEVLNRAIEIETKAKTFYRQAADNSENDHLRSVFEQLYGMEDGHVRTFQDLKTSLTEEERGTEALDPGGEMHFYLDQLKEIHAWEANPVKVATSKGESMRLVLQAALEAEKETVFFYTFLYDFVPKEKGLDKVVAIIREERRHVALLQNILSKMDSMES
jgi:rubrerythrin